MQLTQFPLIRLPRILLLWLLLTSVLAAICFWQGQQSLTQDLRHQLQHQLPQRLKNALNYRGDDAPLLNLIQHQLNQDLAILPLSTDVLYFHQCRGEVAQIMANAPVYQVAGSWQLLIEWTFGKLPQQTRIAFSCEPNWQNLLSYPGVIAALLLALLLWLPRPLSHSCKQRKDALMSLGIAAEPAAWVASASEGLNPVQTHLLMKLVAEPQQTPRQWLEWITQPRVARLSEDRLIWFSLAYAYLQGDFQGALEVALSDDGLHFAPEHQQLRLHGLELKLGKTPYFYLLWYAWLRQQDEGWHLNPAINRADTEHAQTLLLLMEKWGGHAKAINDLKDNGLRAKTLDQNRNKLKAELSAILGDKLSQDYLFETERDLKSGRNRYRLALQQQQISFSVSLF